MNELASAAGDRLHFHRLPILIVIDRGSFSTYMTQKETKAARGSNTWSSHIPPHNPCNQLACDIVAK